MPRLFFPRYAGVGRGDNSLKKKKLDTFNWSWGTFKPQFSFPNILTFTSDAGLAHHVSWQERQGNRSDSKSCRLLCISRSCSRGKIFATNMAQRGSYRQKSTQSKHSNYTLRKYSLVNMSVPVVSPYKRHKSSDPRLNTPNMAIKRPQPALRLPVPRHPTRAHPIGGSRNYSLIKGNCSP